MQVHEPPPLKQRRRWRRRIIAGTVAVLAGAAALAGLYAYLAYAAEWELNEAIAEADRLDPGWRFDDIEAARPEVPDAENSALVVAAAYAKIPKTFLAPRPDGDPTIRERLDEGPPQQRLDDAPLAELRRNWRRPPRRCRRRGTSRIGRAVDGRWRGRHDFLIATLVPHLDQSRRVTQVLILDAAAASADGHTEAALRSCRAALNAGRSMGDEPTAIAQLVRRACVLDAVRALERVLAQGEASAASLEGVQRLLAEEAAVPSLLITARAERAMWFQALEAMRTGNYNRAAFRIMPSRLGERFDKQVERVLAHGAEAAFLRYSTAAVEAAKLPPAEQEDRLRALPFPTQKLPPLLEGLAGSGHNRLDWAQHARGVHRAQALLRCAETAMAAERYRLAEHRWPADLNALVPRYLAAVPSDPFDGRPLRLRRLADGIVVYSVGPDRADDGGKLDRQNPETANTDIGFQLWAADRRGVRRGDD